MINTQNPDPQDPITVTLPRCETCVHWSQKSDSWGRCAHKDIETRLRVSVLGTPTTTLASFPVHGVSPIAPRDVRTHREFGCPMHAEASPSEIPNDSEEQRQ